MIIRTTSRAPQSGVTYVEVLIATLLVLITLVPMMDSMHGASLGDAAHVNDAVRHEHMVAKMEEVLAAPFFVLEDAIEGAMPSPATTPSSLSDGIASTNRRLVFVSYYDGDNADSDGDPFTGGEPDLIWVRTEIEGTHIAAESLVFR